MKEDSSTDERVSTFVISAINVRDKDDGDSVAYLENPSLVGMRVFDERDSIKVDYDEFRAVSTGNVREDDDNDSEDNMRNDNMRNDKDLDNGVKEYVWTRIK